MVTATQQQCSTVPRIVHACHLVNEVLFPFMPCILLCVCFTFLYHLPIRTPARQRSRRKSRSGLRVSGTHCGQTFVLLIEMQGFVSLARGTFLPEKSLATAGGGRAAPQPLTGPLCAKKPCFTDGRSMCICGVPIPVFPWSTATVNGLKLQTTRVELSKANCFAKPRGPQPPGGRGARGAERCPRPPEAGQRPGAAHGTQFSSISGKDFYLGSLPML